jgi:hypothetical protein
MSLLRQDSFNHRTLSSGRCYTPEALGGTPSVVRKYLELQMTLNRCIYESEDHGGNQLRGVAMGEESWCPPLESTSAVRRSRVGNRIMGWPMMDLRGAKESRGWKRTDGRRGKETGSYLRPAVLPRSGGILMCCQDLGEILLHCRREEGLGEKPAEREGWSCLSCVARGHHAVGGRRTGRGGATVAIQEARAEGLSSALGWAEGAPCKMSRGLWQKGTSLEFLLHVRIKFTLGVEMKNITTWTLLWMMSRTAG